MPNANRVDLADAVQRKTGLSYTESLAFVELVLKNIIDCIARGEPVKLSSFGSFMARKNGQRIGRNPKTGKDAPIAARQVAVFKASPIMKRQVNGVRKLQK